MTLRKFELEFDRPNATYAPGELVSGTVIVDLTKEKSIRGLYVTAKGNAQVHWSEHSTRSSREVHGNSQSNNRSYSATEQYFTLKYSVLDQTDNAGVRIPEGYHQYQFHFQLPLNIPCSFEHLNGHIRYSVKAVMDRPWKFDHECKAAFTVINMLDLNTHYSECIPIEDDTDEYLSCCCCFHAGYVKLRVTVPSSGYVPGQVIQTRVNFHNRANNVEITRVCTKLQQAVKLYATTSTKRLTAIVAQNKIQRRFSAIDEVAIEQNIPPIPPSRLEHCNIIELNYKLLVSIHVSGLYSKIKRSYPILIGTIPLQPTPSAPTLGGSVALPSAPLLSGVVPYRDNVYPATDGGTLVPIPVLMPLPSSPLDTNNPSPPYPTTDNKVSTSGLPEAPQPPLPIGFARLTQPGASTTQWDHPPPSYEECTSGATHIRDRDDSEYVHGANTFFAPRYPMFHMSTQNEPKQ